MTASNRRSRRPYLIRAMYEWMSDNGETPHIVADCSAQGVLVPPEYVRDDRIVLNISDQATTALRIGNETIEFESRFGGVARTIAVPISAVIGIYAKESGDGMLFGDANPDPGPDDDSATGKTKKPQLKVVK